MVLAWSDNDGVRDWYNTTNSDDVVEDEEAVGGRISVLDGRRHRAQASGKIFDCLLLPVVFFFFCFVSFFFST